MENQASRWTSSQSPEHFGHTVAKTNMSELQPNTNSNKSSEKKALCAYFVVKIKPAEISGFCCSSVSVSESTLLKRFNKYS